MKEQTLAVARTRHAKLKEILIPLGFSDSGINQRFNFGNKDLPNGFSIDFSAIEITQKNVMAVISKHIFDAGVKWQKENTTKTLRDIFGL